MRERSLRDFLMVVGTVALPASIASLWMGRIGLHAFVNRMHSPWADVFFAHATYLADGWVPVGIGLVLLFVRWRWFLMLGVSTAASAVIVQVLKRSVFMAWDRPSMFTASMPDLHLVPGVEMLHHNSFPSGHAACAFSMCFASAVMTGRRWPAILLAVAAVVLGYSRVYLSQHFTQDVLGGAFIGTMTAWLVYRWLYRSGFSRRPWLDGALIRR